VTYTPYYHVSTCNIPTFNHVIFYNAYVFRHRQARSTNDAIVQQPVNIECEYTVTHMAHSLVYSY